MKLVKCNSCSWVHFEVSTELLNDDWSTCCFKCGGSYKNFSDAEQSEVPRGSTIQPILDRTESK